MADVDHPKTHVEDQDLESPRKQPESPKHEGIDPLTESDTMYPRVNDKDEAAKFNKKEEKTAVAEREKSDEKVAETVADQQELDAQASTPNALLPENDEHVTLPNKDLGDDNAALEDTTDKETGTENTSPSNKTTEDTQQDEVKAAEKKVSTKSSKR